MLTSTWSSDEKTAFRAAHTLELPKQQVRHNPPHADLDQYFGLIYGADTTYRGMVTIVGRKLGETTPQIVAVVPVEKLGEWAAQMHVSIHIDYYYSRGQHHGNATWGLENAFSYNAVYIDLDCHNGAASDIDELIAYVSYGLSEKGLPAPGIVEHSGRGCHLVWPIKQVSAQLGWMVSAVSQYFSKVVGELLAHSAYKGYSVDIAYASNISGLTRLPGTYNTASGTYADYRILHEIRLDLPKLYESVPKTSKPTGCKQPLVTLGNMRVNSLLRLAELREFGVGERNNFCLHLFCAAQTAGMSNDEALALVKSVNSSFAVPMRDSELKSTLSSAMHKHYKFSNARIIDDLAITADELVAIGLRCPKRDTNRARKARNAAKKTQRDKRIMRLYLLGHSTTEIAARVGNAYNTVRKVTEQYKDNYETLFTSYELQRIRREKIRCLVLDIRLNRTSGGVFKKRSPICCAYTGATSQPYSESGTADPRFRPPP